MAFTASTTRATTSVVVTQAVVAIRATAHGVIVAEVACGADAVTATTEATTTIRAAVLVCTFRGTSTAVNGGHLDGVTTRMGTVFRRTDDVHFAAKTLGVTCHLVSHRTFILGASLLIPRTPEGIIRGRGDTAVGDLDASSFGVLGVVKLPQRRAFTENLTVLRAADGDALVGDTFRDGGVARRVVTPVLNSDTELVDIGPGGKAAPVDGSTDLEVVRVTSCVVHHVVVSLTT